VGDVLTATGYDIYDQGLVRRPLLVLASELEPGDSGSAVVDSTGSLIGIAVAIAPDRPGVAYALDVSTLGEITPSPEPVGTGDCLA
jgi:S1-C subfamily serine protease